MATETVDLESQTQVITNTDEESPAIFKRATRHIILKFQDVVYKVEPRKNGWCSCKSSSSEEKAVLKGVTGAVLPGEMLAMLGPSGSGKTTLLTALGGRLAGIQGSITYNDKPFSHTRKRNIGFVTQDDILYPHLTVTETLVFTALLRLPNTFSKEEKIAQAEEVLAQLDLVKCKDSIVGGPLERGVSGGERKRVSIGQEMLINPSLLFLDEPTSGLDSTTAQRIVLTLWELAKGGRTVVMTIHQPSSRLFYIFPKVLLLSDGNPLYFGKGDCVMDYFSSIGHSPVVAMNPADFLLDLANGVSSSDTEEDNIALKQELISSYQRNLSERLKAETSEIVNHNEVEEEEENRLGRWSTTWWQQFSVLLLRDLKERKHESFSVLKIAQVVVVAIIAGLLWWQSDISNIQDQVGLLFFYSEFWCFFPVLQSIFTFPQERTMLTKERSSGMYRLSSYFMSRTVVDLPMELALPTIFVLITYFMAGLNLTIPHFFETLFGLLLSVMVAQSLGLAIGAVIMDLKTATTLGSILMLTFLITGGYYVQHVPRFIEWIKHISICRYTFRLLLITQFSPRDTYPCGDNVRCTVGDVPMIKLVGLDHVGIVVMALTIMLVGYRLIAYLALMRLGETR